MEKTSVIIFISFVHIEFYKISKKMFFYCSSSAAAAAAKSLQSCLTLCDPMDCSPPGFSVHRIPQARILERAAVPSSRGSSRPSDWTCVSCLLRWQMGSVPLAPPGKPLWLPYTIAIPLQVVHIREIKMYVHTETCTQMVVTVFFFLYYPQTGNNPNDHQQMNRSTINPSTYQSTEKMQTHGET